MSQSPSNASRQRHLKLLLAWRERDDGDRAIAVQPMVICFSLEKQGQLLPKMSTDGLFSSCPPPPSPPLALAVKKSPAVYILSPALDGLWREYRGSVNRLSSIGSRTFRFQLETQSWWQRGGRSRFRPVALMIIVEVHVIKIAKWDSLHFLKNTYHGAYINQV